MRRFACIAVLTAWALCMSGCFWPGSSVPPGEPVANAPPEFALSELSVTEYSEMLKDITTAAYVEHSYRLQFTVVNTGGPGACKVLVYAEKPDETEPPWEFFVDYGPFAVEPHGLYRVDDTRVTGPQRRSWFRFELYESSAETWRLIEAEEIAPTL